MSLLGKPLGEKFAPCPPRPLIALSVICGNEEGVIRRFIRSFRPAVDFAAFVIAVGAKEQDGTENAIYEECTELDLPHSIGFYQNEDDASDWPHVDSFAKARQQAWEAAAASGATYLMWADCDDVLKDGAAEAIRAAAKAGKADICLMPYWVKPGGAQVVLRERMAKNNGCAKWVHDVHETLGFTRDVTFAHAPKGIFLHEPLATRTGSLERNERILMRAIKDAPRYYFHLQQQFFMAGDKRFRRYAEAFLAMPNSEPVERYEAYLNLAQLENGPKAKEWAAMAYAEMPDRREALALLTCYAIVEGNYEKALDCCNGLIRLPKPTRSYWTLNHEWYGWKGSALYAQVLRLNNKHKEAEEFEAKTRPTGGYMFSVCHPTLWRTEKALEIREIWLSRAKNPYAVEYVFGVHECDTKSVKALAGFKHSICPSVDGKPQGVVANNDRAVSMSTGKIILSVQDDIYPPMHWDELLLSKVVKEDIDDRVFWAVSDGFRKDRVHVTMIMSRAYMDYKRGLGDSKGCGFGHLGYNGMFVDNEICYRAYRDAKIGKCALIDATDIVFFHDHPAFNKSKPWDETYKLENAPEHYEEGRKLFNERNPEAATDGIMEGR
jgi:hypothetical protein